jgi:hypothetical protein
MDATDLTLLLSGIELTSVKRLKWCGFFDRKNPLNKVDFFWVMQGAFTLTP